MNAEFYYKEEFPLELRIKINNINELRLLESLFFNIQHEGARNWKRYTEVYTKLDSSQFDDENFPRAVYTKIYNTLAEIRKKHESKDVLQGDLAEGAENRSTEQGGT